MSEPRQGDQQRGSGSSSKPRDVLDVTKVTPKKQTKSSLHDSPATITRQKKTLSASHRSAAKANAGMDPFEVRVRFTQFLGNLNASVTSAQKTAQYAIKYRDMDEDLHNCIIEQLERVCILFID
jgi:hypothetical protein